MTIPFFIEEPITWKQVKIPQDIVYYCDSLIENVDREDLRYIDCVWMHMGYYGASKDVMKAYRNKWNPPVKPIFK